MGNGKRETGNGKRETGIDSAGYCGDEGAEGRNLTMTLLSRTEDVAGYADRAAAEDQSEESWQAECRQWEIERRKLVMEHEEKYRLRRKRRTGIIIALIVAVSIIIVALFVAGLLWVLPGVPTTRYVVNDNSRFLIPNSQFPIVNCQLSIVNCRRGGAHNGTGPEAAA